MENKQHIILARTEYPKIRQRVGLLLKQIKMRTFNELKKRNILSTQAMSFVRGGEGGTCGYMGPGVNGASTVICNISREEALWWYGEGGNGAHWCCDSCGSTSYCGDDTLDHEAE